MMRSNPNAGRATALLLDKLKFTGTVLTLAGNLTLDYDDPTVLVIDPGGSARDVTLPALDGTDAQQVEGRAYIIVNAADGDEAITVEDADENTICTVAQNERALVVSVAGAWYGMVGYIATPSS